MLKNKLLVSITVAALALGAYAGATLAQSGADVLKAKGCLNCHDAEKKKAGPSIKDIAAKKGKVDVLTAKVSGAKGHPKVNATEAEVKAGVEQMLSTK